MARSAKKKKSKKATDPELALRRRRIAIGGAAVLGVLGVLVAAGAGVRTLDRRAASLIAPGDPGVEIVWPTDSRGDVWLPMSEQRRLGTIADRAVEGTRALSAAPLEDASRALMDTGWFSAHPKARWTGDGVVTLTGDWRVPAAAVLEGGREILIDWDARVLPISYRAGASNQFVITNAALPSPGVGAAWDEPEILDALRLRELLARENLLAQVEGVDLGSGRGHGVLTILTNGDARVVWGGGPGRERPAEMPTEVKIERLRELQRTTGRIDATVRLVDIRGQHILMQRREN